MAFTDAKITVGIYSVIFFLYYHIYFSSESMRIVSVPFVFITIPLILVLFPAEILLLMITRKLCNIGFYYEKSSSKKIFRGRYFYLIHLSSFFHDVA